MIPRNGNRFNKNSCQSAIKYSMINYVLDSKQGFLGGLFI